MGGVSLFVVAFAVYPLAAALFREADIPRRLIPGCIALGAFTFTMTALPGTPQIQNLIPTKYFGTNMYAAPTIGIIAALLMFGLGIAWLEYRKSKAKAAGEGYGKGKEGEVEGEIGEGGDLPNPILAILPLVVVLGLNLFLTNYISGWDPAFLQPYKITLSSVVATWSLIIALVVGIILAIIFGWRQIKNDIAKALNEGTIGSLLAIMNTASEVGYGNVISALPGFRIIANALLGIQGSPLISEALAVNILAGITGSASGGMSIALETMGEQYMEWAARTGISPQLLHRIASLSCGGLDTLPHNGAVITLLAICGLTHRESYVDIGMVSAVIPVLSTAICVILASVFRIV
jgi:H+/gluconate symporter-like permease